MNDGPHNPVATSIGASPHDYGIHDREHRAFQTGMNVPQTNVQRIAELVTRLTYREMNEMCNAIDAPGGDVSGLAEALDTWAHGGSNVGDNS